MSPEKLQTMRIVWGALLASTFLYLVVVVVIQQDPTHVPEQTSPLMPPLLAAVAVGLAVASIAVPRFVAKKALLEKNFAIEQRVPEEQMFAESTGRKRYFKQPDDARSEALPALQSSFILGMALAEAIAIFGFLLLFLGFEYSWGLPFFGVCWALMLGRFPSPAKLDQQIEEAYDADLKVPATEPGR